ncbi:hypothetical protein J4G52_13230, partial [Burkholderia cenocepacia]|uniref:hypothetical protein n=1 Tax=Burkholderia cenocepacia TaxID=95486 RepID=UPI001AA112B3
TWICIHCSFWSIASLCAQKADCTERWLRFTSREVAHYYFAPNIFDLLAQHILACARLIATLDEPGGQHG